MRLLDAPPRPRTRGATLPLTLQTVAGLSLSFTTNGSQQLGSTAAHAACEATNSVVSFLVRPEPSIGR
jgi:hypothetical protein